jgi:hypothetical protein
VWEPSRALAVGFLSDREYVSKQRNRCEGKGVDRVVGAGIGATGTVLDARMTQRWVIGSSRVRVGGCLVVVVVVGGLYCPAWHVVCAGVSEPKGKTDRQTDRQTELRVPHPHPHTHTPAQPPNAWTRAELTFCECEWNVCGCVGCVGVGVGVGVGAWVDSRSVGERRGTKKALCLQGSGPRIENCPQKAIERPVIRRRLLVVVLADIGLKHHCTEMQKHTACIRVH